MLPATVAALVGAGVLSVLVYPSSQWGCTGQRRSRRRMRESPTRKPPLGPTRRRTIPVSQHSQDGQSPSLGLSPMPDKSQQVAPAVTPVPRVTLRTVVG